MRVAVDTCVLVAFFIKTDILYGQATEIINHILKKEIEYACISKINIAELGYVLERLVD